MAPLDLRAVFSVSTVDMALRCNEIQKMIQERLAQALARELAPKMRLFSTPNKQKGEVEFEARITVLSFQEAQEYKELKAMRDAMQKVMGGNLATGY